MIWGIYCKFYHFIADNINTVIYRWEFSFFWCIVFYLIIIPIIIKLNAITRAIRVSKSPSGFREFISGCIGYSHLSSFSCFFIFFSPFNILLSILILHCFSHSVTLIIKVLSKRNFHFIFFPLYYFSISCNLSFSHSFNLFSSAIAFFSLERSIIVAWI